MLKYFFLLLVFYNSLFAQFDISAAMGLDFKNSSSLRDYLNTSFPSSNQISNFKSAANFNFEIDYKFYPNYYFGVEYNYLIDSYNSPLSYSGVYELSYSINRPSLLAYYVIPGEGYKFKFGLGLGLRFVNLSERIITQINYKSAGYGFILKAEGNTMLSENLFALIGFNFRTDRLGEVENNGVFIKNKATNENLNMNSISFGIYLGLTYTF